MKPLLLTLPLLFLTACGGGSNDEGENPGDCSDNIDNDSDSQTDCFDAGCSQTVECLEGALTGEKGDQGDQGEEGDQGEKGDQGEPGVDGLAGRTVLRISHDIDLNPCATQMSDGSWDVNTECCPSDFSATGLWYDGDLHVICVEDTPSSRAFFVVWRDLEGRDCLTEFSSPGDCCNSGFTHVGYSNPQQTISNYPICLED